MIIKRSDTLALVCHLQGLINPDRMAKLLVKRPSLYQRWQDYGRQGRILSRRRLEWR
jgi:hypothetical protein